MSEVKTSVRRLTILADCTYHPPETLTWYRRFKKAWSGPVPEAIFDDLTARGVAVEDDGQQGDEPGSLTGGGGEAGQAADDLD
jgi:3'-phosphoadenosine 5'-phosphosulfate sulfotransferase (PAPS reductase)/FAD synthetase